MRERLSFYIPRNSPIHRLNPFTKLTLAFGLVLISFLSPWYWTPLCLILLVIFPLAIIGQVGREFFTAALRLLVPVTGFIFIMQSLFLPGGETVLFHLWFLQVTLESVARAFLISVRIFGMVSSFILLLLTTHPSELMTDLTRRGLPGTVAYVIISTLQILPQMQAKAQTIIAAQRSRGLEVEGSFARRVRALVPLVGPLVFGSLVEVEERAIAIEARAFSSTVPKTSYREIADTPFDRIARWLMVGLVVLSLMARFLS